MIHQLQNKLSLKHRQGTASSKAKGEVVNVGNTKEVTILELAQKIKETTKSKASIEFHPLPKDDPKRHCPNIDKLEKSQNWKPNVNFDQGLNKTVKWF